MRILILTLITIVAVALQMHAQDHNQHAIHDRAPADSLKGSPSRLTKATIGKADVEIAYSSPAVRQRIIWGGLVAYDEVWVTGAHNATSFTFSGSVTINGTEFAAGKYAFFTIPGRENWTVIFNRNWDQHLADEYDVKDDLLRFQVTPSESQQHVERLTYSVIPKNEKTAVIEVAWDSLKISFEIVGF